MTWKSYNAHLFYAITHTLLSSPSSLFPQLKLHFPRNMVVPRLMSPRSHMLERCTVGADPNIIISGRM